MKKFIIKRSTLYEISKSEKKFKAEKEELRIIKATKQISRGGWFEKFYIYIQFCQEHEKSSPIYGPELLEKASWLHCLI